MVLTGALVAVLAGCGGASRVVHYTDTEATLAVGETLIVDFGEVNASIGDSWDLTSRPDADVLSKGVGEYEDLGREDEVGGGAQYVYRFEAVGPGTTTLRFTYSYRGTEGDPEGRTENPTPEITVTVTE